MDYDVKKMLRLGEDSVCEGQWRSLKRKGKLNIVEVKKQAVIISFSKPCWENAVAG